MEVNKRIRFFLKSKGITIQNFESSIGRTNGYLSHTKSPTANVLSKIMEVYPELNINWLLTGQGNMEIGGISLQDSKNDWGRESDNSIYHFTCDFKGLINIFKQKIKPQYSIEDFSYLFDYWAESREELKNNLNRSFGRANVDQPTNQLYNKMPKKIAYPMFCMSDKPIERHNLHKQHYGEYGIGFSKTWAIKKGISLVSYAYPAALASYLLTELSKKLLPEQKNIYHLLLFLLLYKAYDNKNNEFHREFMLRNLRQENREYVRYFDEREWRWIPLKKGLLIIENDLEEEELKKLIKKKQLEINSSNDIGLDFDIDDVTHVILPTEEKKEEFLKKIAEIEEYKNDIDKIRDKIIIGNEGMKRKEKEDEEKLKLDVEHWKDKYISLFDENKKLHEEKDRLNEEMKEAMKENGELNKKISSLDKELTSAKRGKEFERARQ
jgi:transcriptional regulator with XRE-family HTH domain